jgi:hypothetical protein
MKIDIDYLKSILDKFIESESQYINSEIFTNFINENIEKFSFHWDILLDKDLVVNQNRDLAHMIRRGLNHNNISIKYIMVRLNDTGYKFYEALEEKEFLNKVKKDFKNVSMDTLLNIASRFLENKISKALQG